MPRLLIDARTKIEANIDAIFGYGISSVLPLNELYFVFSKRTGRIKNVLHNGNLMGTLRTDGWLAMTIYGADLLLKNRNFMENCVTVRNDVVEFVSSGKSVFCKHVIRCGTNINAGSEVAVLDESERVVAVGKAVLPSSMIMEFRRGVAVKVREGLKAGRSKIPI